MRVTTASIAAVAVSLAAALLLGGCQERLTSPGECPALCPGGTSPVFETIIGATPGLDSSFAGYVARGAGSALLVSSGLPVSEDRTLVRFSPRPDTRLINDTVRTYTVDSVALAFTLVARDTAVKGLRLYLYRLPPEVDSTAGFAEVEARLVDANLVDSIVVPDSVVRGLVRTVRPGDLLIPEEAGTLRLGVRLAAAGPTGVRLAASGASGPSFTSFATANIADTAAQHISFPQTATLHTFVSLGEPVPPPETLPVGGAPSSRALIRFELPPRIRDSATIVRATLELTPSYPFFVLPGDSTLIVARGIVSDLGAKSPVVSDPARLGVTVLPAAAQGDAVSIDAVRLVQLWQGATPRPSALLLSLSPEAASFSRPAFESTRSAPPLAPRLRISYQLAFPFENP